MGNKKIKQIFVAIILAVFMGHLTGMRIAFLDVSYYQIYALIGQLFLNALTLVVVPLVASSIITSTAKMGKDSSFTKLGLKTFSLFLGTTACAILIGWILSVVMQPGQLAEPLLLTSSEALSLNAAAEVSTFSKFEQILLRLIPPNILAAASQGQMLGLIFFSLLFGYFTAKIDREENHLLLKIGEGVFQVMMKITALVMKAMPIGVFGLVAKVVASTGIESLTSVGHLFLTVILGLIIFMFGFLSLLLKLITKRSPLACLKAMNSALITAFSTSSSAATLPVSLNCLEKNIGVSNRIASFILPLGSSLNLAGSALQVIVSVFFITRAYHFELSFATQVNIFFMSWLLSIGVAGIPSASLISIVIILTSLGLPADGVGLLMAAERILDMCRTVVNVYTTSCCAILVAHSERENLKI